MMIDPLSIWLVSAVAILIAYVLKQKKGVSIPLLMLGFLGMVPILYFGAIETPRPWVRVWNYSDQAVSGLSVSFSPVVVTHDELGPDGGWGARVYPEEGAEIVLEFHDAKGVAHTHKARLVEGMLFLIPELEIQEDLMVSWGEGVVPGE